MSIAERGFPLYTGARAGNDGTMRDGLPLSRPGQVIGLLGGSFDPPHAGHVHISREALRRFGLDRVWWLVSPGNPLKRHGPAPLPVRMAAARALLDHPRIDVTDFEARLGTRYTAETLAALRTLCPGRRFVWLMGADNLAQFHRWQDWRRIMATVPVGVLARPGQRISARLSVAAGAQAAARRAAAQSQALGRAAPPAWCFVNVPMMDISSSALRARGITAAAPRN
jgi:nicotinate-nucleotide adenylyltransferase